MAPAGSVDDVDKRITVVDETGHRGQRALAVARVVPKTLTLQEAAQRIYRQLVAHTDDLAAARASRAVVAAPSMRWAIWMYGSPHDGVKGSRNFAQ